MKHKDAKKDEPEQFIMFAEHNHCKKKTESKIEDLDVDRKKEVIRFIQETSLKSNSDIADALNSALVSEKRKDVKHLVTAKQIQLLKKNCVYTKAVTCIQDLYTREELAMTLAKEGEGRQQFIRQVVGFPLFLIQFSSTYQVNELRRTAELDQFFLDGTFKTVEQTGLYQLYTLLRKQTSDIKAKPLVFSLLERKNKETYNLMFQKILELNADMKNKKLIFHLDFEIAARQAILENFPNAIIICCVFHLLQAVLKYLKTHLKKIEPLRDPATQKELLTDIKALVYEKTQFNNKRKEFIAHWRPQSQVFMKYFVKNYLADQAIHPPTIWSVQKINEQNLSAPNDLTDNQSERFHRYLNQKLPVQTVKDLVKILQTVEYEYRTNSIFQENNVEFEQFQFDGETLNLHSSSKANRLIFKRSLEFSEELENDRQQLMSPAKKKKQNEENQLENQHENQLQNETSVTPKQTQAPEDLAKTRRRRFKTTTQQTEQQAKDKEVAPDTNKASEIKFSSQSTSATTIQTTPQQNPESQLHDMQQPFPLIPKQSQELLPAFDDVEVLKQQQLMKQQFLFQQQLYWQQQQFLMQKVPVYPLNFGNQVFQIPQNNFVDQKNA